MALFTKSVQSKKKKQDGIRILIMRRPPEGIGWDIWMPHLSPSDEVLNKRHANLMTFEEHEIWFRKNVLHGRREYLEILADMAFKRDVTLLCWEVDPNACHRNWVAKEIKRLHPDLQVEIS